MPRLPRPRPYRSRVANLLLLALAALALLTVVGLVDLWPDGREIDPPPGFGGLKTESGTVTAVVAGDCRTVPDTDAGAPDCRRVTARLDSGPDSGASTGFDLSGPIDVGVGDRVRLVDAMVPPGAQVGGVPVDRYSLSDFERRNTLLWLTVAFAVLVVVTSRWQGVRALVGLAASLCVVVLFVVPAILEGSEPVAVATMAPSR